jgi:hypothetical protein
VVSFGTAKTGATVNFIIDKGTGSLSATSAVTNNSGYASVTLTLTNFTSNIQLSVCVAPGNSPCQTVYGNPVAASLLNLQGVTGEGQVIAGTSFQPLILRVTDSSKPPNSVLGASVTFESTVLRGVDLTAGDPSATQPGMPTILSVSQSSLQSDANGLVSFLPSTVSFGAPLEIEIQASAGTTAALQSQMQSFASTSGVGAAPPEHGPGHDSPWRGGAAGSRGPPRETGGDDY